MRRFKNLLVLTSAERPLPEKLEAAADLARRNGATLTLFGVTAPVPVSMFAGTGARHVDGDAPLVQRRIEELEAIASTIDAPAVTVAVTSGTTYVEVIKRALTHEHDLVITAPDAPLRVRLARASTTMHILRKSPVPVWVHSAESRNRTGVAVAVSPTYPDSVDLNRTLLELAASMAARQGVALHVIHAWRLQGESLMRSSLSDRKVNEMRAEAERAARLDVSRMVESVPTFGVPIETHLRKGPSGYVITTEVETIRPKTLVIGTNARTGITGALIGNTAEEVLGLIETSVLAVKPRGFRSPIDA
jgi:nucleotide-binding universal stress UspA family protein